MFNSKLPALVLAAASIALVGSAASANLIANGDFQSLAGPGYSPLGENDPLSPSLTTYNRGNPNMYPETTWNVVSHDTLHGSWASFYDHTYGDDRGKFMIVNGKTSFNDSDFAWAQDVTVEPNTDYTLGAYFASLYADAVATLEFRVIAGTSQFQAGIDLASDPFTAPNPANGAPLGTWLPSTFTFNSGDATNLRIEILDTSGAYTGNDYAIDDISLTTAAVPEPSSLIGVLPCIALLKRHRRE